MNNEKLNEPIQEFENLEQAYKYLKEWQDRLFLNDWIIVLNFVEANQMPDSTGEIEFCFEKHTASISLVKLNADTKNRIQKNNQEHTLVHELLYLKFIYCLTEPFETYESKFLSEHEHSTLEQLSKSLIMAKYDLKYDWFRNFEVENENRTRN